MNTLAKRELKAFKNFVKIETDEARKSYERAKKNYEKVLKSVVLKTSCCPECFEAEYKTARYEVREDMALHQHPEDIDDLSTFKQMIFTEEFLIENCYFESEEK